MYWMISVLLVSGLNANEKLSRSTSFSGNYSALISLSICHKIMKIMKNVNRLTYPKCKGFVNMQESRINSRRGKDNELI